MSFYSCYVFYWGDMGSYWVGYGGLVREFRGLGAGGERRLMQMKIYQMAEYFCYWYNNLMMIIVMQYLDSFV
jgi:hypothetical protein